MTGVLTTPPMGQTREGEVQEGRWLELALLREIP